jgi:hypothetical protein
MGIDVSITARPGKSRIACVLSRAYVSWLKHKLLVAGLLLTFLCVAILGAPALLQSLSGYSISTWRLVLFFANAFFCGCTACTLYARGRRARPQGLLMWVFAGRGRTVLEGHS